MPGPAAYGLGGEEATVTDAAVVLGWLGSEHPLAGSLVLDVDSARAAVGNVATAADLSVERCADGIIEIANAAMVRALRTVSVERGVDPRLMTLVAFGGAGPLFACRMADSLGMKRALVPPHAGVLSALGLAAAPEKLEFVASLHRLAHELGTEAWPVRALSWSERRMKSFLVQSARGSRIAGTWGRDMNSRCPRNRQVSRSRLNFTQLTSVVSDIATSREPLKS